MKANPVIFALLAAAACTAPSPVASDPDLAADPATTPPPACQADAPAPPLIFPDQAPPSAAFNFLAQRSEVTAETLVFANDQYRFIFCRPTGSWAVQASDAGASDRPEDRPEDYQTYLDGLANPDYEAIALAGQTYQARVRLEAPWLTGDSPGDGAVFFELILPGQSEPISTLLYDTATLDAKGFGAQPGVPRISRALVHEGRLWWSITFSQGEGDSGVATVVEFDPSDSGVTLWQPDALGDVQINDMAIVGSGDDLTLWLATQYSGEGNPYLPAKGLVSYQPQGRAESYTVANSPLAGAIPTQLVLLDDSLWVATGNGVCELPLDAPAAFDRWRCWRFTAEANLPDGGVALYDSLLAPEPATTLTGESAEVLWVAATELPQPEVTDLQRRYEVLYPEGFEVTAEVGAQRYVPGTLYANAEPPGFYWPGQDWHWGGERFVRSLDEVPENRFGLGPSGIGPSDAIDGPPIDWNTLRGELTLLSLTPTQTQVRYHSGWVEADDLSPYITVLPQSWTPPAQPNPLAAISQDIPPVNPFQN